MVAEVVPEKRRIEAGALLYTSAPFGLVPRHARQLRQSPAVCFRDQPEVSWRYVFLSGLLPAAVALLVRLLRQGAGTLGGALRDRHAAARRRAVRARRSGRLTISGLITALTALIMWWSCNAFIPVDRQRPGASRSGGARASTARRRWRSARAGRRRPPTGSTSAACIGTLLTVPAAKYMGRRPMFGIYFVGVRRSPCSCAFGLDLAPETRIVMYFPIGLTVFGVFGSFTYYLPELFPTRLRGTGSGFCYNIGRVVAAVGPFLVGTIAARGAGEHAARAVRGRLRAARRPAAAALGGRDARPPARGLTPTQR